MKGANMRLVLYADELHEPGKRLYELVKKLIPQEQIDICPTIKSLSARLSRFAPNICVTVLLALDRSDLLDFLAISGLLHDVRVVLILPDREKETVSLGHRLYPRYISYMDSGFEDIQLVLRKILVLPNYETTSHMTA